ncbi:hypothetical protein AC579_2150 [Pseudocercospora musae]|uniref:Ubiquitin-like domain-containing protein n=1 Tax=Pseudocercospora musae TaxID=113226 RepID=A0A139IEW3_9PEZI|nr:hypothetical protein AC579_2150 [Pseudocercospora musae]
MGVNTAMKHHNVEVNINTTIEVPLETILASRVGDDETLDIEAVTATLKEAAIDAIKAHPKSAGDTSSSLRISSSDLREIDRAASGEAAAATDEVKEMTRKSLLEDSCRLKRWCPDAKTDSQTDARTTPVNTTPAALEDTRISSHVAGSDGIVNIRVQYNYLVSTRQTRGSSTVEEFLAEIRASLPKVPDHYRRLVWIADLRPEAEAIVLRGSTKLWNTNISKFGTVHLQPGECDIADPGSAPAPEEREIRVAIVFYNEDDQATDDDDSWVDGHGVVRAGPEMIVRQKACARNPQLHSRLMVVDMRPTNTFLDVKKAMHAQRDSFEVSASELYMSLEDQISGRQADDELTLEEAGVDDGESMYWKKMRPVSGILE